MKLRLILTLLSAVTMSAYANDWPTMPIKIVVPYSPGGITDDLARSVGVPLSASLGVPVIYEYKPGISGIVGANFVAKSNPDGYTLLLISNALATSSLTTTRLPYKVFEDFTPISLITKTPAVLVIDNKLPVNTFADLIRFAQDNPGKINYATSGIGSLTHLAVEKTQQLANFKITHIPYKGQADIWRDFMSGQIDTVTDTPAGIVKYLNHKNVKILGVTSSTRLKAMPTVPTLSESGLKGFEAYGGFMILGPEGVPPEIVDRLSKTISSIVNSDTFKNKFEPLGMVSVGSTPKEASDFLKNEFVIWKEVSDKINRQ